MIITEQDKFKKMLAIPENENDNDNDLFFLTIENKEPLLVCVSLKETNEFIVFSTSYTLCKQFTENEITLREAISSDSVFYTLTLNENGIKYEKNKNGLKLAVYDFNHSNLLIADKDIFDQYENINHVLDASIESFY